MKISEKQRIVICGSMSFYSDMIAQANALRKIGIEAVVPSSDDPSLEAISDDEFQDVKRSASMRHIRKIRDHKKTFGILVVNRDKHGVTNYIGPNAFAEIAVAFAHYKRIYLYQGIPAFYQDELLAWRVVCLNGDLSQMVNDLQREEANWLRQTQQLDLFSE